jgi:uncharacterized protein (TIGR03435 family)
MTSLQGKYRFTLDVTDHGKMKEEWDPSDWFTMVKSVGLKLEPRKGRVKFVVIDHLNTEPTPN